MQFAKVGAFSLRRHVVTSFLFLLLLNTLNRHLTLLKIAEDPMCPLCGEDYDTSLHLLGRCSALVKKRRKQL